MTHVVTIRFQLLGVGAGIVLAFAGGQAASAEEHSETYVVQPGDTLTGIASRFGLEVPTITAANGIADPDIIAAGMRLRVPSIRLPPIPTAPAQVSPSGATAPSQAPSALGRPAPNQLPAALGRTTPGQQPAALGRPAPGQQPAARGVTAPGPHLPAAPPQSKAGSVLANAMKLRGAPYAAGGAAPAGFDCSGFVHFVFAESGSPIPRTIWDQYQAGAHPARADLHPGDLVFFENTYMDGLSHVGIYVGDGRFIHAVDEETGVAVSSLRDEYWTTRWFGATRIP